MAVPTTTVTGLVFGQGGASAGVKLSVRLTQAAVDPDHGVIVPETVALTPDADGSITVELWPNARGTATTQYRLWATAEGAEPIWEAFFSVPDTATANLRDLL